MIVAELAEELELPVSAVLERCAQLNIDATWAGAELQGLDVVVLRAELAAAPPQVRPMATRLAPAAVSEEDLALFSAAPSATPAEPDAGAVPAPDAGPVAAPAVGPAADAAPPDAALPPTAVASMPALADELAAEGAEAAAQEVTEAKPPSRRDVGAAMRKHYHKSLKSGAKALFFAVVVLVGANVVHHPLAIVSLWIGAGVLFAVALVHGNRARYHITTHPERRGGLALAVALMALGTVGLLGFALSAWVVVRPEPAADAPLGMSSLDSVHQLRWDYQRLRLIAATGWERPAKEDGTCWRVGDGGEAARRPERVETGARLVRCSQAHTVEVIDTFAPNHDADAPFPGVAELERLAVVRCLPAIAKANEPTAKAPGAQAQLRIERPTQTGWDQADHDITCLAVTPVRNTPIHD